MLNNNFKSGLVTIAGRTNVGKSTLINQIMQTEIAIETHKPQTTRHLIKGIYEDEASQIIFIDSPGMHKANDQLGHHMQKATSTAIQTTDLLLLVIDARSNLKIDAIEKRIIRLAHSAEIPLILVINKIDLIKKENLLPLMQMYLDYSEFKALVPISAKHDNGIDLLISEIKKQLPSGPPIIIDGSYTDQTEKILASEYIRSEIIHQISEEIPYSVAIKVESFEEIYDDSGKRTRVKIHADILCERNNHKMILVGKKGKQIASIGKASRQKIMEMLECPCDLMLFVKVEKDWRNRSGQLKELGYTSHNVNL